MEESFRYKKNVYRDLVDIGWPRDPETEKYWYELTGGGGGGSWVKVGRSWKEGRLFVCSISRSVRSFNIPSIPTVATDSTSIRSASGDWKRSGCSMREHQACGLYTPRICVEMEINQSQRLLICTYRLKGSDNMWKKKSLKKQCFVWQQPAMLDDFKQKPVCLQTNDSSSWFLHPCWHRVVIMSMPSSQKV